VTPHVINSAWDGGGGWWAVDSSRYWGLDWRQYEALLYRSVIITERYNSAVMSTGAYGVAYTKDTGKAVPSGTKKTMFSHSIDPQSCTHFYYRYAPHKDDSVNDGPHVRRWSHNIII